jgi:Transmembrane amino acid transporter protein
MSVVDSFKMRPSWAANDNDFSDYFILVFFVICFLGSLPSKIAALRYFTFITAVINLLLGAVVSPQQLLMSQISSLRNYFETEKGASFYSYKIDNNLFGGYCLSLFSSVNQFSVVNILGEYRYPTERRVNKVVSGHQLIFWSPFIPLVVYLTVAVGGYLTCGDKCDEIIINRSHPESSSDTLMNIAKLMLLICLVVGIIIRNQSNKAGLFGIIDQFQKIQDEEPAKNVSGSEKDAISMGVRDTSKPTINDSASGKLSDELRNASTMVLNQKIESKPTAVILLVQLVNSMIPALTAVLVKDDLITYVEAGSGFLAPVFIIIYPCLITIRLHQKGVAPVSPTMYIFIWAYLIFGSAASYACLVMNVVTK